jgi:hypothetical protein
MGVSASAGWSFSTSAMSPSSKMRRVTRDRFRSPDHRRSSASSPRAAPFPAPRSQRPGVMEPNPNGVPISATGAAASLASAGRRRRTRSGNLNRKSWRRLWTAGVPAGQRDEGQEVVRETGVVAGEGAGGP